MSKDAKPVGDLFRRWRRPQTPDAVGTPSDAMPDAEPSQQDLSTPPPHAIFISYSRADSLFAKRLVAELQQARFSVWLDRNELLGGQLWQQRIDAAIVQCTWALVSSRLMQ
jgi:TIR domain